MALPEWIVLPEVEECSLPAGDRKLLNIARKLVELSDEQLSRSALLIAINELNTHAEALYAEAQERWAEQHPQNSQHRQKIHGKILKQLAAHSQDFKDSGQLSLQSTFIEFLALWLTQHVRTLTIPSPSAEQQGAQKSA